SQGGFDALDNTLAEQGATNLSSALSGASAVREDTLTLNVLGHSYGSTTASIALTRNSTPRVDTFVTIGSAGLPSWIDSASRLNVGA
ncbi:alpha/beta hydrolase, partial [Listeria monocytogenes]|uniref:alpha/beta hydrolase n=1 Tax=Listeria monocytogenes TaxID=1639 RepID=UPI003FA4072C